MDFLKLLIRKIKIQFKLKYFDKFKKKNDDHNFFYVTDLRETGIFLDKHFLSKSDIGKKIINQFESINKKTLVDMIEKNYYVNSTKSFKQYLTNYFYTQDLIDFANQETILKEVGQYFGFKPYLRYISVWLDHSTSAQDSKDTQLFHRDSDDLYLIKVFFYLNDVDINNGSFQYIKYSHKKSWLDYKNDFLLDSFANNIVSCEAKKGSLILCDTNGYHRGLKIKEKNYRALLTINYTSKSPKWGRLQKIVN